MNIDFYILKAIGIEASMLLACRLAEKAYLNSNTVYIHCEENKTVTAIDKLLWTFKEESFIPHTSKTDINAPITIGCNNETIHRDILINLHPDIHPDWQKFNRILDIVTNETVAKEKGRQRYKYYREANCQLSLHEL